ncbi:MAG TPA: glycerol-3-phosphate dehydrogenase/oxidase [Acidobacteriota bacterium]|nr:glycerol-3-phosphate dehydrogenase/oxidase [Acidobacteriota bacterium]
MKRDIAALTERTFDLVVVGAGIYGAAVAWEAAARGLSVALIDKADFASGNSSSSLKIIHGGLRYLQSLDIPRMRTSVRERMFMLCMAPHLVHPLPCLMPTYPKLMKSKPVMRLGMLLNDIISFDLNRRIKDPCKKIPRGRVVSRQECFKLAPGLGEAIEGLGPVTGGAVWHDAQMYNSERLELAFVMSAARSGALAANYVEANGYITEGNRVVGLRARDLIGGGEFEIGAKVVLNTVGSGIDSVLSLLRSHPDSSAGKRRIKLSTAMNFVIKRPILGDHAVGVRSPFEYKGAGGVYRGSRVLFLTPWRQYTLAGTQHLPFDGNPDGWSPGEEMIAAFVEEVNRAYPGAKLRLDDIGYVHSGIIPMEKVDSKSGEVNLTSHHKMWDHARTDNIEGLLSVVGVKYTTARNVAERTVGRVFRKLQRKPSASCTLERVLVGGHIGRFSDYLERVVAEKPNGLESEVVKHLVHSYGSEHKGILSKIEDNPELGHKLPGSSEVLMAEVSHAVREEMAVKLADVTLRRTDLGSAGNPGEECLQACAALMAVELGWDDNRRKSEIEEAKSVYPA